MRLIDNPLNAPVIEQIKDDLSYATILKRGIQDAEYLVGHPNRDLKTFYDQGMLHPMLSKVRYALMCLGIRNPDNEAPYHEFCSIHISRGKSCCLADYFQNPVVLRCIDQMKSELETQKGEN